MRLLSFINAFQRLCLIVYRLETETINANKMMNECIVNAFEMRLKCIFGVLERIMVCSSLCLRRHCPMQKLQHF
jgi:hypothetical protein